MTKTLAIDTSWTLFLDRDGTINRRIVGDYVREWDQFEFLEGAVEGIAHLSTLFARVIVVTNQQGIGRGLMSHQQLRDIHAEMLERIAYNGGRIDEIYYCPDLAAELPACRKPEPGMALQAAQDYPDITFTKSIMVGDTASDMAFGKRLGMATVLIVDDDNAHVQADIKINSLQGLDDYLEY